MTFRKNAVSSRGFTKLACSPDITCSTRPLNQPSSDLADWLNWTTNARSGGMGEASGDEPISFRSFAPFCGFLWFTISQRYGHSAFQAMEGAWKFRRTSVE
jgi:hypothetical protein